MKRLDLIIDALDRVDTFDWNQQDNKLIKDARIAACELRGMEPVAYMHVQGNYEEPKMYELSQSDRDRGWTEYPLYALGDEK